MKWTSYSCLPTDTATQESKESKVDKQPQSVVQRIIFDMGDSAIHALAGSVGGCVSMVSRVSQDAVRNVADATS